MAQKTVIQLVDDLDGTEIQEGGETVSFSLDDQSYEIDLTNENARGLRDTLSRYTSAGRRVSGRRPRGRSVMPSSKAEVSPRAVREWAKANKVDLSARGRIPQSVIDQFRAAGN